MKTIKLGALSTSNMAMGCMRIAELSVKQVRELIETALECGINLFDHADIYGAGQSEALFGQVLQEAPGLREQMRYPGRLLRFFLRAHYGKHGGHFKTPSH